MPMKKVLSYVSPSLFAMIKLPARILNKVQSINRIPREAETKEQNKEVRENE